MIRDVYKRLHKDLSTPSEHTNRPLTRSIQVECGSAHVDGRPYCQGQNIQNEAQLQEHMELGLCDVRELGVPLQTEPNDPGELEINRDTEGKQKRWANVCSAKTNVMRRLVHRVVFHRLLLLMQIQLSVIMEADPIEQVRFEGKNGHESSN